MSILEPSEHSASRPCITGVIVVVLGRRYRLELSATDERVFSLGSAMHADVRVIGPEVAPIAVFFERAEGGVQLVPGYSERPVFIDGRPLSGATLLGARHSLDVGGIAVTLETFKRGRDVPSESGVNVAPSDDKAKAFIDPRENARRLALRAREIVDDEAQTQLAIPSGRTGLLGGYPGISERSARSRPRGRALSVRTAGPRRTPDSELGADVDEGGSDCGDDARTKLFALVGHPPMAETILEDSELGRLRQERAARILVHAERAPRLAIPGSRDVEAGRRDEVYARPHRSRGMVHLPVSYPVRWFTERMARCGTRTTRRLAYVVVAALGLVVGVVLVVAFSAGRTATASSVETRSGAAVGTEAARTPTHDLLTREPRAPAAGRPQSSSQSSSSQSSSSQSSSSQSSSSQSSSSPATGSVWSARLPASSPMRNAEATEGKPVSSEVGISAPEAGDAESRPGETPVSELGVAALAHLEAGRYSEAAARYAAAARACPESAPHRVIARLMQRASSQRCSGAAARGLALCPEVQR